MEGWVEVFEYYLSVPGVDVTILGRNERGGSTGNALHNLLWVQSVEEWHRKALNLLLNHESCNIDAVNLRVNLCVTRHNNNKTPVTPLDLLNLVPTTDDGQTQRKTQMVNALIAKGAKTTAQLEAEEDLS